MPPAPLKLSRRANRTPDSPISELIQQALATPGLISLAAGLVDEPSLPAAEVRRAAEQVLSDPATAQAALQYGSTQGYLPLREKVLERHCAADRAEAKQLGLTVDDVILTTGSQQILYLLGEAILDEGDIVITEAPSYFVYHSSLGSHGVRVLGVPMDEEGMDLAALESLLQRLDQQGELGRVKLIYTVDYFQNPTGLTLSESRRPQLIEVAKRYSRGQRILVLEDAAYRELRYEGEDLPSLKKFDPTNEYVITTATFSKPCAPGLKTGYAILPQGLMGPICAIKGNHDFGSSNLNQYLLNQIIASGDFDRHVEQLRQVYQSKRDVMLGELTKEFADWPEVRWTRPEGGLYVWLRFPKSIRTTSKGPLARKALAEGVIYVPGDFGYMADNPDEIPHNEVRLSFGVANTEQIREGIRRLRRACRGLENAASKQPAMA